LNSSRIEIVLPGGDEKKGVVGGGPKFRASLFHKIDSVFETSEATELQIRGTHDKIMVTTATKTNIFFIIIIIIIIIIN